MLNLLDIRVTVYFYRAKLLSLASFYGLRVVSIGEKIDVK
jgi:hypothetical protein